MIQKNPKVPFTLENVLNKANKETFIKIEVKYDGTAVRTKNLVYETWNKNDFGWSVKTRADRIWIFVVETDLEEEKIVKWRNLYIIDIEKWRDDVFRIEESEDGKLEMLFNKSKKVSLMKEGKDRYIADVRYNIEYLKRNGIINKSLCYSNGIWIVEHD